MGTKIDRIEKNLPEYVKDINYDTIIPLKVAIFGARDGEYVKQEIEKSLGIKVLYFVDNNTSLQNDTTISAEHVAELYARKEVDAIIVAVRNAYNRWSITHQLQELGIEKIGLVWPSAITYKWSIGEEEIKWVDELEKPLIHYLEVHAIDGCNLNCKGCLHFSNLYKHDEKTNIDKLLEDVKALSDKAFIFHLRVLGGEPLLNPELPKLLDGLREKLPDTDIGIVTNGTLITKQSQTLFDCMKKNRIGFNITLYPPTHSKKEEIYHLLEEHGVSYGSHIAKVDEFSKGFKLEPTKGRIQSHTKCVSKNCFFLREGKLYKCAPEALINRFYETYNIPLHFDTGIDIYNDKIEWEKVIPAMYEHPVSLCRYCSETLESFEWGVANPPRIEDWIVKE